MSVCKSLIIAIWFVSYDIYCYLREEVFGPVAPLLCFKTEEEAIHMANDTNAGSFVKSDFSNLLKKA